MNCNDNIDNDQGKFAVPSTSMASGNLMRYMCDIGQRERLRSMSAFIH